MRVLSRIVTASGTGFQPSLSSCWSSELQRISVQQSTSLFVITCVECDHLSTNPDAGPDETVSMHLTVSRRITKHVSRRGGYVEIGLYHKSLQLILACCFPVVHFHGSELRPQSGHAVAHDLRDHFMEQRIVDAIITPQGLPRRRHLAIISSISIAIFFIISNVIAVFLITAIITIVIIIITIIIVITMSSLGCGEVACAPGGEWQVWNLRIPQPPPCTLPSRFLRSPGCSWTSRAVFRLLLLRGVLLEGDCLL